MTDFLNKQRQKMMHPQYKKAITDIAELALMDFLNNWDQINDSNESPAYDDVLTYLEEEWCATLYQDVHEYVMHVFDFHREDDDE